MTDTIHTPTYEETDYARDLKISPDGRETLDKLQDEPGTPFSDTDLKDLYVLAASYGYRNNRIADADATGSSALVQRETLSDEQESVMEAIAVAHEGTPMVLQDQQRVATIAQRYALGGLDALLEFAQDADNFQSEFTSEITASS
jgi:hypothetical protein